MGLEIIVDVIGRWRCRRNGWVYSLSENVPPAVWPRRVGKIVGVAMGAVLALAYASLSDPDARSSATRSALLVENKGVEQTAAMYLALGGAVALILWPGPHVMGTTRRVANYAGRYAAASAVVFLGWYWSPTSEAACSVCQRSATFRWLWDGFHSTGVSPSDNAARVTGTVVAVCVVWAAGFVALRCTAPGGWTEQSYKVGRVVLTAAAVAYPLMNFASGLVR